MNYKNMWKRFTAGFLSAAVLAGTAVTVRPFTAVAAETVQMSGTEGQAEAASETIQIDPDMLADPDELLAAYMAQAAGSAGVNLYGTVARDHLNNVQKAAYDILKEEIGEVADGKRTSTQFTVPVETFLGKRKLNSSDLGTAIFKNNVYQSDAVKAAIQNKIGFRTLLNALLSDCPYELYWYDKTIGAASGYSGYTYSPSENGYIEFPEGSVVTFSFTVDTGYRGGDTFTVDTSKTAAPSKAVEKAASIVSAAKEKSDYDKLQYYREQICSLVTYDKNAVSSSYSGDLNPWQLIYVFDEDASTNVVCEGYSKAFQYLCDLTEFDNPCIYSYLVTGNMDGGPHMWNVVHLGGNGNYLVDVTNCDTGTIGSPDRLFLTGYTSGSADGGYKIALSSGNVTYTYDSDCKSTYSTSERTLVQSGVFNGDTSIKDPNFDDEGDLDTTEAAHFYKDYEYSEKATNSTIRIVANGTKNYSRCVVYTDITPTYNYTVDKKGNVKASTGKVLVGITSSSTKPELTKGKIVDKSVAKIAAASIKSGQITVTAKSLPGIVYLWVMDTGKGGESACIPVTVKPAPSATNLYAVPDTDTSFVYGKTKQCKSAKISVEESRMVYLYPYYKNGKDAVKLNNASYTAQPDKKISDYIDVSQVSPNCFQIKAKALKSGKNISGKITFTCGLNGKKAVFTATVVNQVRSIGISSVSSGLTKKSDSDHSVSIRTAAGEKVSGTMEFAIDCSSSGTETTDSPKVYAMGSENGYNPVAMAEGKVTITDKKKPAQGKISMKIGKDKKTATITAAKNTTPGTTAYFLVVYNTYSGSEGQGYKVISVTAD